MAIERKKTGGIDHGCDEYRALAKRRQVEVRKLHKGLNKLSGAVLMSLHAMDAKIAPNKAIPRDVSEWIGKTCGALEMQNGLARQAAGMDFTAAGKIKALKKLMGANAALTGAAKGE